MAWQVLMDLDDHLDQLAAGADHRLQFQHGYRSRGPAGIDIEGFYCAIGEAINGPGRILRVEPPRP